MNGWKENDTLSELLWEDLGIILEDTEDGELSLAKLAPENNLVLEREDSKYKELLKLIKQRIAQDAREKIVIFSFYRGTVNYLARRLRADQISCAVILSGMGDEKHAELQRFADPSGGPSNTGSSPPSGSAASAGRCLVPSARARAKTACSAARVCCG